MSVAVLALKILWVRRRAWKFTLGARVLLEDLVDEPSRAEEPEKMQRFIAETLDDNYRANQQQIESEPRPVPAPRDPTYEISEGDRDGD